jgi:FtsX-like permease family
VTPVASWFRLDLRRRWRSLLVLALLIAFAAGTVMTAVAGARRGGTAVERLLAQTLPATVLALPNQPGFDWDAVRALPEVEALSTFVLTTGYVIEELPRDQEAGGFPFADDEVMRTIERGVVLDGRLPDPDRADEVVISPAFEDTYGLGVGDAVTLRLYAPETQDALALYDDSVEPDGPTINARIVGVVRTPAFVDPLGDGGGGLAPSPGLFAQYAPNLLGASGQGIINAMVRLRGGEAAMADFKAGLEEVSGRRDIDLVNLAAAARHARDVSGFEADALLAFGLAAGVAAVFLVGQSIARYSASTVADLQILRSIGLTPHQSRWAAAIGPTLAALLGSALGVSGALVASRWFPIGSASLVEPAPGLDLDLPVMVGGAMTVPVLVAAGAVGAAWFALRSTRPGTTPRRSTVATAAARRGVPVPVVVGTRFALEPGRGRNAVPVRPALVGAVVGVLGVVAAFTFSDGVNDAAANPARFGQVHQLEAFVGISGEDFGPVDEILPIMAADPDVAAVDNMRISVAEVERVPVTLFTLDPVDAPWEPVVTEGRTPDGPDEVALAPGSAEAMGVAVGDVVPMNGTLGVRDMTVSGIAFVPEGPHNDYVTGGWVTAEGYDTLVDPDSEVSPAFKYHVVLLALRPGADPGLVTTRIEEAVSPVLAEAAALTEGDPVEITAEGMVTPPEPPSPLAEVQQVRVLPVFLAGFLALLALGAVGHAVATAVRRRRYDVAVLRALGMTRRQSRGVVVTQASVLALVGLVLGVPLGVALGRTVWRYVADTTPLFYVPPVAVLALLLVAPVTLLAANLLAAWPSQRAASMRVGHVLRAE